MLIYKSKFVEFSMFHQFPNLICSVSTRLLGNLNVGNQPITNALPLLNEYNIKLHELVSMRQIHSNHVQLVDRISIRQCIPNTDGLVTQTPNVFLGVKAADCVPAFLYYQQKAIVGVVHAGWRGTLNNIYANIVLMMNRLGAQTKGIYVAIGPHIGGCCYSVPTHRARLFVQKFDNSVVFKQGHDWHIDLGKASIDLLHKLGIPFGHIEAPITCTSCQNDLFFSYRKNKDDGYGEMLGIIGLRAS